MELDGEDDEWMVEALESEIAVTTDGLGVPVATKEQIESMLQNLGADERKSTVTVTVVNLLQRLGVANWQARAAEAANWNELQRV